MRRRGSRIDQNAAEQARDYCLQKRDAELAELSEQLGTRVSMHEIASINWLVRTFDAYGINYPRTAKGDPSFKGGKTGWMVAHQHWLPRLIATANKYEHDGSTFLEGHILLRRVDIIALDTETNDEGLRADRGSAWPWRGGYICGISVAYRADGDIRTHYFPLRHPDTDNFDPAQVYGWLKDLIASDVRIVTQNGFYDWGWLRAEAGIVMPPSDRLEEIGALATIIDENQYQLQPRVRCARATACPARTRRCCDKRSRPRASRRRTFKNTSGKCRRGTSAPTPKPMRRTRSRSLRSSTRFWIENRTRDAYRLEVDLLPMVLEMRRRGIRIDQDAAEQAREQLLRKRDAALAELSEQLGKPIGMAELNSPKWKATTFDAHRINYPRTDKGNPSFKAGKLGWMAKHEHWLPQLIADGQQV